MGTIYYEQIVGNNHVRRAFEVAIAGEHSIMFIGNEFHQADLWKFLYRDVYSSGNANYASPCKCGFYRSNIDCTCTLDQIYKPSPGLHYDITTILTIPSAKELEAHYISQSKNYESLEAIFNRISNVDVEKPVKVDNKYAYALMAQAIDSGRKKYLQLPAYYKSTINVAKTIAKLGGSETVEVAHLAEAIAYCP